LKTHTKTWGKFTVGDFFHTFGGKKLTVDYFPEVAEFIDPREFICDVIFEGIFEFE
jgi:hypothetical protein